MRDVDTAIAGARRWLTAAADAMSSWHGALRLLLAAAVVYAAGLVGFVLVLAAGEAITGCGFVNCGEPHPLVGATLLLPMGAVLVVMVAALAWALSPRRARAVPLPSYAVTAVAVAAALGALLGFDAPGGVVSNAIAGLSLSVLAVLVVRAHRHLVAVPMALLHAIEDLSRTIRLAVAWAVAVGDVLWVLFVAAVSSCGFAGGRCPDPSPEPLLDRDGLWLAGGWTLAAGVVVVLLTNRRRHPAAWLAAAGAAVVGGLVGA